MASNIARWFSDEGFEPYVAIESQSIQDLNAGIIGNLKAADYYVFVDFRREQVRTSTDGIPVYRGSLFTQQELAIAYVLGFEQCVFLRQSGVLLEGIGQYILSNAASFEESTQALPVLQEHVRKRGWAKHYSRHLRIEKLRWSKDSIRYGDHTGANSQRVLFGEIHNRRLDVGALDVVVRLVNVKPEPSGRDCQPVDRSNLKWAGHPAYSCIIRPGDYEEVALNIDRPTSAYLHSELDVVPRQSILSGSAGAFLLAYEVFAQHFPILRFTVRLTTREDVRSAQAELVS